MAQSRNLAVVVARLYDLNWLLAVCLVADMSMLKSVRAGHSCQDMPLGYE